LLDLSGVNHPSEMLTNDSPVAVAATPRMLWEAHQNENKNYSAHGSDQGQRLKEL
jgi:hypothetical protein